MENPVPRNPTVAEPRPADGVRGRVRQVQQRHVDGGGHRVGDQVHGVGAEQHQVDPARLEATGGRGQQLAGLVPAPARWSSSISAKSTEASSTRAECSPPRRSATNSLASR